MLNDADSLAATDWLLEIDCDFATLADRLNDVDFSALTELQYHMPFDFLIYADLSTVTDSFLEFHSEFHTLVVLLLVVFTTPVTSLS
ncbi:hypothetical protein DD908_03330, partial [Staphylococcus pseudintermedius]